MNQSDLNEIGRKVLELLNHSKDIGILEKDLTSLVDEYSEIFPKVGRAATLQEITSQLYNNDLVRLPFFRDFALMAFTANAEIGRWQWAERVAYPIIDLENKLFLENKSNESHIIDWFQRWAEAVEKCASEQLYFEKWTDSYSWPKWGTAILEMCEVLISIAVIQEKVQKFWNSMIDVYGPFDLPQETLLGYEEEFVNFQDHYKREMDSGQIIKHLLEMRVNFLYRLEVGDIVDRMNMMIELIPGPISSEELEIEISYFEDEKDPLEKCRLANRLATKLRLAGDMSRGIEVLSKATDSIKDVTESDVTSVSALKLGIYLDENGRKEEAESLFRTISDAEHGPDSVNIRTVDGACQRLATILVDSERYEESKEYTIRHNSLAEMMGDAFLFVRSCFNIVADCHELGQKEEAEEWFVLGMANLKDGITRGSIHDSHRQQLLRQSSNIAVLIGRQQAWEGMMKHIFQKQEK